MFLLKKVIRLFSGQKMKKKKKIELTDSIEKYGPGITEDIVCKKKLNVII